MLTQTELTPGFLVVHANLPEQLRALCTHWMAAYPLDVFEAETILVQSNGIAQWLKLALAAEAKPDGGGGLGIAAGLTLQMPQRFVWQLYRSVLSDLAVPEQCAFDKDQLHWRLLRLLPSLLTTAVFAPLSQYLQDDESQRKLDQLALKLADLFDQYQVYRADWLLAWQQGRDVLIDALGQTLPLESGLLWQPALWRAILADMAPAERSFSRAALHQQFLQATGALKSRPARLPRRLMLFGISSLSQQTLEALAAVAPFCQILLTVHNPCQHYWADIVADKDLLRCAKKRQQPRPAGNAGHPLLAAWGKQGRDYIRLLDQFDQTEQFRRLFQGERIDLFSDVDSHHLLGQLQQDILQLSSLEESRQHWPALTPAQTGSLCFARCHTVVRELEVLHDDLLQQLAASPGLQFSDIIVMVPDINDYAAAIHAVFGRYKKDDDRYLPFTIADQAAAVQQPMLQALKYLLQIRQQRFAVSELIDLLQVPELAGRFALSSADVTMLTDWLEQAGAHWGLHSAQRQSLGIRYPFDEYSLMQALCRMLLGYACGAQSAGADLPAPLPAVEGIAAEAAGALAQLLQQLELWWQQAAAPRPPAEWFALLRDLLEQFFLPADEQSQQLLSQLLAELSQCEQGCQQAALCSALDLAVVADAWLAAFEKNSLQQRFLAGAVNFASLLPMRAIPFKQVHLLGMQDGAFPRASRRQDFDLMGQLYRPGDRSRREDDRYLLLEALLSARERLRISWLGFSVHDNSPREPSVLVAQLRDHLARGWQLVGGEPLLAALTTDFPLKAYSQRYQHGELTTYQREWRSFYLPAVQPAPNEPLSPEAPQWPLQLRDLAELAADPIRLFFRQRLKVQFFQPDQLLQDDEAFSLDGLAHWQLTQQLFRQLNDGLRQRASLSPADVEALTVAALQSLRQRQVLPLGAAGQLTEQQLREQLPAQLQRFVSALAGKRRLGRDFLACQLTTTPVPLQDWLSTVYQSHDGILWQLHLQAETLQKDGQWRCRPLLLPWLALLLSAACGEVVQQHIVAPDGDLILPSPGRDEALAILQQLTACYLDALCEPLPYQLKLASDWLQSKQDERQLQKLQQSYDGTEFSQGLVQHNRALQRAYPHFALFWSERSVALADTLLGPLLKCLSQSQFTAAVQEEALARHDATA